MHLEPGLQPAQKLAQHSGCPSPVSRTRAVFIVVADSDCIAAGKHKDRSMSRLQRIKMSMPSSECVPGGSIVSVLVQIISLCFSKHVKTKTKCHNHSAFILFNSLVGLGRKIFINK